MNMIEQKNNKMGGGKSPTSSSSTISMKMNKVKEKEKEKLRETNQGIRADNC